jgi:hypothetical protein
MAMVDRVDIAAIFPGPGTAVQGGDMVSAACALPQKRATRCQ